MAIQQAVNVTLLLIGDGVATQFTYSFDQLFNLTPDSGFIINASTVPQAASIIGGTAGTGTASLDSFGNLVLNFNSAPAAGVNNECQIQLLFNSGTLAGTTQAWTSATAVNTTWTLPLNGNNAVQVGFVASGTLTGGTIVFEVSQDGANWFPIQGAISNGYTALTGWTPGVGSLPISIDVAGFAYFRNRLSSVLIGSGTVTFIIQSDNSTNEPVPVVGQANGANLHVTLDDAAGGNAVNTVVKGTQAARAIGTQDLKDSGRTFITIYADRIAGVTTEALASMTINKGGSTTTGTSYTVTSGKTLRILSFQAEILDTTTTANRVIARLRSVPSGTLTTSSPILAMALAASPAALAATGNTDAHEWSDGIELPSGSVVGVSQLATVTTAGIVSLCFVGYEY